MAYREDEYLMLSGIQHFTFCRRQWALIHIEQQWEENVHTVIGELMHKKVHDSSVKKREKIRSLFEHFQYPQENLALVENVIW